MRKKSSSSVLCRARQSSTYARPHPYSTPNTSPPSPYNSPSDSPPQCDSIQSLDRVISVYARERTASVAVAVASVARGLRASSVHRSNASMCAVAPCAPFGAPASHTSHITSHIARHRRRTLARSTRTICSRAFVSRASISASGSAYGALASNAFGSAAGPDGSVVDAPAFVLVFTIVCALAMSRSLGARDACETMRFSEHTEPRHSPTPTRRRTPRARDATSARTRGAPCVVSRGRRARRGRRAGGRDDARARGPISSI